MQVSTVQYLQHASSTMAKLAEKKECVTLTGKMKAAGRRQQK
jgi:hypothetical protein